jgi:aminopeptidase N
MENTGAITYREAALLLDDAQSSFATKQRVAQVVAHECVGAAHRVATRNGVHGTHGATGAHYTPLNLFEPPRHPARRLSHQWFGNLTTMQWWTQLWLNEGFAKHMEYVVTERLFPAWRTFDHFTAVVQSAAFSLDAMASTHPIEVSGERRGRGECLYDLLLLRAK